MGLRIQDSVARRTRKRRRQKPVVSIINGKFIFFSPCFPAFFVSAKSHGRMTATGGQLVGTSRSAFVSHFSRASKHEPAHVTQKARLLRVNFEATKTGRDVELSTVSTSRLREKRNVVFGGVLELTHVTHQALLVAVKAAAVFAYGSPAPASLSGASSDTNRAFMSSIGLPLESDINRRKYTVDVFVTVKPISCGQTGGSPAASRSALADAMANQIPRPLVFNCIALAASILGVIAGMNAITRITSTTTQPIASQIVKPFLSVRMFISISSPEIIPNLSSSRTRNRPIVRSTGRRRFVV